MVNSNRPLNGKPAPVNCEVLPPMQTAPTQLAKLVEPSKRKAASERFHSVNAVCDYDLAEFSGAETKVWLLLWRDTKRDGLARTGRTDLARRAGISTKSVTRAVASLAKRGVLTVVQRGGSGRGTSIYRVHARPS